MHRRLFDRSPRRCGRCVCRLWGGGGLGLRRISRLSIYYGMSILRNIFDAEKEAYSTTSRCFVDSGYTSVYPLEV